MKLAAGLLIGIAVIGASVSPRVTRSNIIGLEKANDSKVIQLDPLNPGETLGKTRGVYLEGYGAVFSAEVDLMPSAAVNPFRPAYKEAEIPKLQLQKQARVELLKKRMVESMLVIAQGLDGMPANEEIALAVTIPYWSWEKSVGMPRQVVIRAPKAALLSGVNLEKSLKVQEF